MLSKLSSCLAGALPSLLILSAASVLLAPIDAAAQRVAEREAADEPDAPTRRTPTISESVYARLIEAQTCLEEADDAECALASLAKLRERANLSSFESAQLWNTYGYTYLQMENYAEAIRSYERVLEQEDLPEALEQQTLYSLASLYAQEQRYADSLAALDRWFAMQTAPSADAFYLKAQIHYQLQEYAAAVEPNLAAIRIAREQGRPPQEGWHQLLYILYFELEDYPNVIETLTFILEHWVKRDYLMQLAAMYNQTGQDDKALALYEAAYEMQWLERAADLVNYARMLMNADIPYKAAVVMQRGLDADIIESTRDNWRLAAQAWSLAQEDEKAIPALSRASTLADTGDLDLLLAQSYANLARWDECVDAAETGLERGLERPAELNILLGSCLAGLKRYDAAQTALRAAARLGGERVRRTANDYIQYIQSEQAQARYIEETMAELEKRAAER